MAADYVHANGPNILSIVFATPLGCMAAVRNGTAQAYMDDDVLLNWCAAGPIAGV